MSKRRMLLYCWAEIYWISFGEYPCSCDPPRSFLDMLIELPIARFVTSEVQSSILQVPCGISQTQSCTRDFVQKGGCKYWSDFAGMKLKVNTINTSQKIEFHLSLYFCRWEFSIPGISVMGILSQSFKDSSIDSCWWQIGGNQKYVTNKPVVNRA